MMSSTKKLNSENLTKSSIKLLKKLIKFFILSFLAAYRTIGTTWLGGNCRFSPSCSEYAVECLEKYPTKTAIILIFKRLLKCHPFGHAGYDPVPTLKEIHK